ncbi:12963_t:CDS:2 [Funneliformis mosseae]|uniref:12963_t:CDS:1 n=1 Tax=Funneliformis mosseae TaxID=27381 RepID=A0A9N8VPJ1_FUNMO|nr:12963_t:CDS:2 [Funneliformis mosseae]
MGTSYFFTTVNTMAGQSSNYCILGNDVDVNLINCEIIQKPEADIMMTFWNDLQKLGMEDDENSSRKFAIANLSPFVEKMPALNKASHGFLTESDINGISSSRKYSDKIIEGANRWYAQNKCLSFPIIKELETLEPLWEINEETQEESLKFLGFNTNRGINRGNIRTNLPDIGRIAYCDVAIDPSFNEIVTGKPLDQKTATNQHLVQEILNKYLEQSHCPDETHCDYHYEWASAYVFDRIQERLEEKAWDDCLNKIRILRNPNMIAPGDFYLNVT